MASGLALVPGVGTGGAFGARARVAGAGRDRVRRGGSGSAARRRGRRCHWLSRWCGRGGRDWHTRAAAAGFATVAVAACCWNSAVVVVSSASAGVNRKASCLVT